RPLLGRNKILAGVCPGVAGLLPVKLATLLVLAGGVARRDDGGTQIRGELHLLLLGDPGTGKSQLMKWACRASPGRSVLTTGRGSSGAGLTVAAVREGNSWALEAGALVLADGGLCCIDEFDGIRSTERAVIHEAMEQQTVHVAKAGLVTSLRTRTSIIGAVNPRPGTTITCSRPLTEVTGLEGPLLSRFDIVLLLADPRRPDWDRVVAGHVLARGGIVAAGGPEDGQPGTGLALPDLKAPLPEEPLLRLGAASQASEPQTALRPAAVLQESQMTIAQRVAARLAGSAAGVTLPGTQAANRPAHNAAGGCMAAYGRLAPGAAQEAAPGSTRDVQSGDCADGDAGPDAGGSAWTLDIIRSYIAWVRGRPPPVMSAEAERVLVAYYGAMRRAEDRSAARSTIRALESLIRLSQAHARLLCSGEVLLRDAVAAVMLADSSQQLLHIPGGDNVTCGRFPDDPDDDHREQQRIVLTALGLTHLLPPPPPMLPAPPPAPWG
ncbi:DNA helicase MCM9, partial [Tetrabaena socialis]